MFASEKRAIGDCDFCGLTYPLKKLKFVTIRMKVTNLRACPDCWSKDHPQHKQGTFKIFDPQALKNPRPADNADRALTGSHYLNLTGTFDSYASTPHKTSLGVFNTAIDLRCCAALDSWTPSREQMLVGKNAAKGYDKRTYKLSITVTTGFMLITTNTGSGLTIDNNPLFSTVPTGFASGYKSWVRATKIFDNGSGQSVTAFYTSADGLSWTQLGAEVLSASTRIGDSGSDLFVGAQSYGTEYTCSGKIYRAQVYNGVGGTLLADFNPANIVSGTKQFDSAETGELWNIRGGATITAGTTADLLY